MKRISRPAKTRSRASGGSGQAVIAVAAIAATLALAALATDQYGTAAKRQAAVRTAAASNDDDLYTGSILYMPDTSNVCHQWLFDNQNGQFTDNGTVNCERAAYHGLDGPKSWSAARMKVISTGFRDH